MSIAYVTVRVTGHRKIAKDGIVFLNKLLDYLSASSLLNS